MISQIQSLELIHEGKNSRIYHQPPGPYAGPVVIKVLNADVPSLKQLVSLNNEYLITKDARIRGVREAIETIRLGDKPAVVMAHFTGQTLAEAFVRQRQSLVVFLETAIRIASILGEVHQHKIIHMDINSHNILVNLESKEVKLIDFGLASRLAMRAQHIGAIASFSGTPAYMSPEQTGRMNRNVDYRTDLYSLGVTFYEMLTGQTPFWGDDLLAMAHAHMAKTPKPVSELCPNVPSTVSDIVMRLLAKNAEDRYQSAEGLETDLSRCLDLLRAGEDLSSPSRYFEPGLEDHSGQLHIPEKLYGRAAEIGVLMASFERVSSGSQELLMVAGHPGVGKSATVAELHKPVTEKRAYFISGKFDQYQQNTPYVPFRAAFGQLVDLLLAEGDATLAEWRDIIRAAMGVNGAVLTELIPSLEKIVGPQPPIPELDGPEHRNRFNLTLTCFLRAICTPAHPIVIFIDDWQWADRASLELLSALLTSGPNSYLMLIGAYRVSEVGEHHPVMETLDKLAAAGVSIGTVHLGNLMTADVEQLIQESLACSPEESRALAELISGKTDGNPFFVRQLLQTLYDKEWLRFDFDRRRWRWDVRQIREQHLNDNIVVLMTDKLERLVKETAYVLQRAACVGNAFDLQSLATVAKRDIPSTLDALSNALDQGLVYPLDDYYKTPDTAGRGRFRFLHDRVQQAAYAQIPVHERQNVQLEIGRLLLANTPEDAPEQRIFDVVHHYNQAISFVTDRAERLRLTTLNLKAAELAFDTAAFHSAKAYLKNAIEVIPEGAWTDEYDLMLKIHSKFAVALSQSGDFEQMEAICRLTEEKARTLSDAGQVKLARIQSLLSRGELMAAVDAGLSFIEALGVSIPRNASDEEARALLTETADWLTKERIESLLDLPEASVEVGQIMEVAALIGGAVYGSNMNLRNVLISRIIRLCAAQGLTPWSTATLSTFAITLSCMLHDIPKARLLIEVTMRLFNEKYASDALVPRLSISVGGFVLHRYDHLKQTVPVLEEGIRAGLATGNFHGATFCTWWHAWHHLFLGTPLATVKTICEDAVEMCTRTQATRLKDWCSLVYQAAINLEGDGETPWLLLGEVYDEQAMLERAVRIKDFAEVFRIKFYRAWLSFLFDRPRDDIDLFQEAESYLIYGFGLYLTPLFHFYDALAAARLADRETADAQGKSLARIVRDLEALEIWVRYSPMNHRHKRDLMLAEKARVEGQHWTAVTYYKKAISGAKENGFTNEEALACELFGKFWLAEDLQPAGIAYLQNAQNLYGIWGAQAKIAELDALLEMRVGKRLSSPSVEGGVEGMVSSTRQLASSGALDLTTLLKASQTLSQTVLLTDLLKRMNDILLENAGAEKALILYRDSDQWIILAEGQAEDAASHSVLRAPLDAGAALSMSIFNYVVHAGEAMVVADASKDPRVRTDAYLQENRVSSVLCLPIHHKGALTMVLYLENNLSTGAFTEERLELLQLLSGQMAISLENAMMVDDLKTSISERRRAEASLRKYEHIVATSKDLMALINRDFVYEAVNDAFLSYHALDREDVVGTTMPAFVGDRAFEASRRRLELALAGESVNYQTHLEFKGAGSRLMDVSYFPFYGKSGKIEGVVLNARDITETRKLEDQLIQAQKMEAVGTLASGIAHDFNNILSAVMGYAEIALLDTPEASRARRCLEAMLSGSERAKDLVRQILAFSRQSSESPKVIRIGHVVEEVLTLVKVSLPPNIVIRTRIADDAHGVMADPTQVHQIFLNLCTNAHHAMVEQGGLLEVEVAPVELAPESHERPHDLTPGTYIKATVRDTGHGMDRATREKIFEPYFTTKEKGMGTGLGLATVHGIMTKQEGAVTVESEPGKGAAFALYFPTIQLAHRVTAQPREGSTPTGNERILLIDDEQQLLDTGRIILEHLGYEVETHTGSVEALSRFRSRPDGYDLVITDLTMPHLTGDKLAEEVMRIRSDLPVILCTGYVEETLEERAKAMGIRSIIIKPILMNELARAVRRELDAKEAASV